MGNDKAYLDLVKFVRMLTVLSSEKDSKSERVAEISGISRSTMMRLIIEIARYGMIIEHIGSKKTGSYEVMSWGIFNEQYFNSHRDEVESNALFSTKLGALPLDRLIVLLKIIHRRKVANLEELAKELNVSTETIKRQIHLAKYCGINVIKTRSKKVGHYFISDFGCFNPQVLNHAHSYKEH